MSILQLSQKHAGNMTTKNSLTSMNMLLIYEIWELDFVIQLEFHRLDLGSIINPNHMKTEMMHKVSKTTKMLHYPKNKLRKTENMCNMSPYSHNILLYCVVWLPVDCIAW
jgi:hypothetical protein